MALALFDLLTPGRRNRLATFLAGPADHHTYMVHIGAGWAWARLRLRDTRQRRRLHPLLGWLALDGYGFHEGYFHPKRSVEHAERPARLRGYALRAFDAGLGRSLWFVCGADPDSLSDRIGRFEAGRHGDLWSGCGLACAYAGGVGDDAIERLRERAGVHRGALAQGAAFAAKARERAGNPADHTRRAVERLCRTPVEVAAKLCDTALEELPADAPSEGSLPGFEVWRSGIREAFERSFDSEAGVAGT